MLWGKEQQSALYEDFLKCGGKWTESSIYKEITNTHTGRSRGVRRWCTEKQLLQYFTAQEVQAIIHRKVNDKDLRLREVRDHPECNELQQYLTLVEDEEEQIAESRITDVFRLKVSEKAEDQDDDDDSSGSEEEDWY